MAGIGVSPPAGNGVPWDWGIPQKGPGISDHGKNLGLGVPPQKGPGTRDLGKNLGLKLLPSLILQMRAVKIEPWCRSLLDPRTALGKNGQNNRLAPLSSGLAPPTQDNQVVKDFIRE